MGRIVIAEYLTLDGVTEDPGPAGEFEHRGWSVRAVLVTNRKDSR